MPSALSTRDDTDSRERRHTLSKGLYIHLAIFVAAILVLFLINSATRGADGGWWVIWPLQIWAGAVALHLLGVTLALTNDRT